MGGALRRQPAPSDPDSSPPPSASAKKKPPAALLSGEDNQAVQLGTLDLLYAAEKRLDSWIGKKIFCHMLGKGQHEGVLWGRRTTKLLLKLDNGRQLSLDALDIAVCYLGGLPVTTAPSEQT